MDTFNKEELKNYLLSKSIPQEVAEKFYLQDIDGEIFLELSVEDLKELDLTIGVRKKITKLISLNKQEEIINRAPLQAEIINSAPQQPKDINSTPLIPEFGKGPLQRTDYAEFCSAIYSSEVPENSILPHPRNNIIKIEPDETDYAAGCSSALSDISDNSALPQHTNEMDFGNLYSSPNEIDVIQMLENNHKGQKLLNLLQSDSDVVIAKKDVSELVRICVDALVNDLKTLYPTTQHKINLAKAIVYSFPILKSNRDDVKGYEHFFDPVSRSGSIEFRLKTLRVKFPPSTKKNKRKKPSGSQISKQDIVTETADNTDKIKWLQYQISSDVCKAEIFKTMAETFSVRRSYIHHKMPSISDIITKYPKLKDFQGNLLEAEFKLMFANAGSFDKFSSHYTPRILKYAERIRNELCFRHSTVLHDNLKALLILADLLPLNSCRRNNSAKIPSLALVKFQQANISIDKAIKTETEPQPCLMAMQTANGQYQYYVKLDKHAIEVGTCPDKAFDILYKAHWVFNVMYSSDLVLFYDFMDFFIYKIKTGSVRSSVDKMNTLLNNIKL